MATRYSPSSLSSLASNAPVTVRSPAKRLRAGPPNHLSLSEPLAQCSRHQGSWSSAQRHIVNIRRNLAPCWASLVTKFARCGHKLAKSCPMCAKLRPELTSLERHWPGLANCGWDLRSHLFLEACRSGATRLATHGLAYPRCQPSERQGGPTSCPETDQRLPAHLLDEKVLLLQVLPSPCPTRLTRTKQLRAAGRSSLLLAPRLAPVQAVGGSRCDCNCARRADMQWSLEPRQRRCERCLLTPTTVMHHNSWPDVGNVGQNSAKSGQHRA